MVQTLKIVRKRTVGLLLIGLLCSAAGCDGLSRRALHAPAMRYDSAGKSQVDTTEVAQVLRGAGGTE